MVKAIGWLLLLGATCGCRQRFDLIDSKCGTCHTTDHVYEQAHTPGEWDRIIHGIKARGLRLTAEEEARVRAILHKHFTP